jgi:hypothetical protein
MMKLISQLGQMVVRPGKTFRMLLLSKPVPLAIMVSLGALISFITGQWIHFSQVWNRYPSDAFPVISMQILLLGVGLLVFSGMIHLTADMFGGGGRAMNLFYFLQISLLPFWLVGPGIFLIKISGLDNLNKYLAGILIFWFLCFLVTGIREIYRFSFLRALSVILIPIFLSVLVVLFGIYSGWKLLPQVMDTAPIQY